MPLAKLLAGVYQLAMPAIAPKRTWKNSHKHVVAFKAHLLELLENETGQTSAALGCQMYQAVKRKVLAGNNTGQTMISLRTREALLDLENDGLVFRAEGRWWVVEGV